MRAPATCLRRYWLTWCCVLKQWLALIVALRLVVVPPLRVLACASYVVLFAYWAHQVVNWARGVFIAGTVAMAYFYECVALCARYG